MLDVKNLVSRLMHLAKPTPIIKTTAVIRKGKGIIVSCYPTLGMHDPPDNSIPEGQEPKHWFSCRMSPVPQAVHVEAEPSHSEHGSSQETHSLFVVEAYVPAGHVSTQVFSVRYFSVLVS